MTVTEITLVATTAASVTTAIVFAVKGRFDATKGEREVAVSEREAVVAERAQANDDAQTTIGLLRDQVKLLREHRDEREQEIKDERAMWIDRETKLERRLAKIEEEQKDSRKEYTNLVKTITQMKYCADADTCKMHNPGDRREVAAVTI
jgi:flagellar motility protein MotE (MotC chaperone)